MVTSTERVAVKKAGLGKGTRPTGGNGKPPRGNGNGSFGNDHSNQEEFSPEKYRIAMWVALAAIMMMFTAMVSAYIVLSSADTWRSIMLPRSLWISTVLIISSSVTFKSALNFLKQGNGRAYRRWLSWTLVLGLAFLGSQLLVWRQLVAQGVYLSGNVHSSFFYLLTSIHGVHLLGGVLALVYLLLRTRHAPGNFEAKMRRQTSADVVSLYWHSMDGLWVFLFLLLWFWR